MIRGWEERLCPAWVEPEGTGMEEGAPSATFPECVAVTLLPLISFHPGLRNHHVKDPKNLWKMCPFGGHHSGDRTTCPAPPTRSYFPLDKLGPRLCEWDEDEFIPG